MLLRRAVLEGVVSGRVTLQFRRWKRPTVRAGGTLRTPAGVLAIDAVDPVEESAITEEDARGAGMDSRDALLASLPRDAGRRLYRISLRYAGADPRTALRNSDDLTEEEVRDVTRRLDRFDRSSRRGPWTRAVLQTIAAHPGVRAPDLAAKCGVETPWFKRNVRKLKELGLTVSLSPGYRLSKRGRAWLERTTR